MNADLPEPAEYYRPKRARELREKAARVEWLRPVIQCLTIGPYCLAGSIWVRGLTYFLERPWGGPGFLLFQLLLLGAILALGARVLTWPLLLAAAAVPGWAAAIRSKADALEAEHAARYGSLPDKVP